jgi:hypothetical protein
MCSSDLVSSTWLEFLSSIASYSSRIDERSEYGQNAGSQFVLLKNLCNGAEQTITNSLEQFLNQTFITNQIISEEIFKLQATAFIEEWKTFTTNSFNRTLQLVRAIQYGNHLAAHRSNSDFDVNVASNTFILNSSISYDQCNCMLSPSCHSPMGVHNLWSDHYHRLMFDIPNFFMGCFRVDALLSSTLECFYNQTCMNSIDDVIQYPYARINFTALDATRNLPNETIDSVVSKLFVDDWSQNISFLNYFTACAPQSCTYEYIGRKKLLSLATSVTSILGSLSTGLEIIFLVLLWLAMKVRYFLVAFILLKTPVQG